MKIRFQEEHLHRFRDASRDFNPLHLSEDYARKTPYGERVVYGVLGFLACLGQIPAPQGRVPEAVRVDFKAALVLDVDYTLQSSWEPSGHLRASLMDGSVTVMRIHLQFREGLPEFAELPECGVAPLAAARKLAPADFQTGLAFRGTYSPGRSAYLALLDLCGVDRERWGDTLPLTALCSSYLTGMELPGECAAYSGLRAEFPAVPPRAPSGFEIALASYDERFGMLHSKFELGGAAGVYARGEISSMARPEIVRGEHAIPAARSGSFAGQTAVLIGASRGLGAAIALELAAEGCTVFCVYSRSGPEAASVVEAASTLPGRVVMEQGDASDPAWCCALKEKIEREFGRLDLLICNAAPAIQPLRVEAACYDRIQTYVQKGFALVGVPLSSFIGLVSASQGGVLLISSSAVEKPPGNWPHYVALKGAVEGLLCAVAADHPKVRFWISRPNKIDTDLINTPMGRLDAEKPESVAQRIVGFAAANNRPGSVHLHRWSAT